MGSGGFQQSATLHIPPRRTRKGRCRHQWRQRGAKKVCKEGARKILARMFPVPPYKKCPSGAGPQEGRVPIRNPNGRTWGPGSVQMEFRPGARVRSRRPEGHELPDCHLGITLNMHLHSFHGSAAWGFSRFCRFGILPFCHAPPHRILNKSLEGASARRSVPGGWHPGFYLVL